MSLSVEVYWSFRSPYSYLATPRMVELEAAFDLVFRIRPVLPLAVRSDDFFDRVNPLWPPYLMRDTQRIGESMGIPFRWPRPDPVVQAPDPDTGKLKTAPDQPYIHRLTRIGQLAAEDGRGLPFITEVSSMLFGSVDNWHEGTHLAEAAARAGCDLSDLDARAEREADRLDAAIEASQDALEAAGHWGVPTFVFEGEPFFGQDRLDVLLWRLEQHGLTKKG